MDIAVVQAALSNFSDFVDNVIELFQGVPKVFLTLGDWFSTREVNWDDDEASLGEARKTLGIVDAWTETTEIFGGSSDDNADPAA